MKKILITGGNSYIGRRLERWLGNYPDKYLINAIDIKNDIWTRKDFSEIDVIFHVAGIAHIKETKKNADLYYKVNRDLAYDVAQKAKKDGVKQFIFLSSMSVYGINSGMIDKKSLLNPKSHYGKSKLQAEELIEPLADNDFKIVILRPPMIYGKGCKGNYPRLVNLVLKLPFFPDIENKRSMIYIDNLCEFIRLLIDGSSTGLYLPQNQDYVCTSEMVRLIAKAHGKKIWMTKVFNPLLRLLKIDVTNKIFGDLVYDKEMSEFTDKYCSNDFKESISLTEAGI